MTIYCKKIYSIFIVDMLTLTHTAHVDSQIHNFYPFDVRLL